MSGSTAEIVWGAHCGQTQGINTLILTEFSAGRSIGAPAGQARISYSCPTSMWEVLLCFSGCGGFAGFSF